MRTSKQGTTAAQDQKSLMEKAAEQVGHLKEGIIAGKNKMVEMVEEKVESVKHAIHEFTAPQPSVKKTAKKAAKKLVSKAPAKKAAKKTPKKMMKKSAKKTEVRSRRKK